MGAKIINENDPANGSTYVDKNITEIGSQQDLNKIEAPIGGKDTKMISIENIEYPKNCCAINELHINLPPVIVKDLMNQAYYFNDRKKTNSLIKVLEANNVFKSLPETDYSRVTIRKLDKLYKQWLKAEEVKRPLVLTYGSYQLGVQDEKSDLDLLCIAPESKTRDDWINNFYAMLKSRKEAKDVEAIRTASIPIIHLKFNGIEIQLAFVQLNIKKIPISLDLVNDMSLEVLDQQSNRTLNAWYATKIILHIVPNVKLFKFTLRAIRLWAKRNGLYSNKLGYIGGISWAILVAKTCLLYPKMDAAGLIHKFFFIYANWEWQKPVYLIDPCGPTGPCHTFSYNLHAQTFVMPIMTPTYPTENSAGNITLSNSYHMRAAFSRAYCIIDCIMMGKALKYNFGWQMFFEASDFINNYNDFIVVSANSFEGAEHYKWQTHIEYKLVNFLRALERKTDLMPCVDTMSYRPKNLEKGTGCSIWFIGLANSPISFEANGCYAFNHKTLDAMETFKVLSHSQAILKRFGTVELQVKYMRKEKCITYISQDLEIRN